jgi:hypothetical protein
MPSLVERTREHLPLGWAETQISKTYKPFMQRQFRRISSGQIAKTDTAKQMATISGNSFRNGDAAHQRQQLIFPKITTN